MVRCLMLIGSLLAGQVETPAGGDTRAEVGRLVRQLDSPRLADRDAAEAELLRRGPAVLDVLPPVTDSTPAEIRQRLGRIRQKLQQQAAEAAAESSTITLHADAMPLSKILAAFQSQSGNTIVDYRRQFGQQVTDPELKVDFDKTPFWPALDQVLDQAGLTVYPYAKQRAVGVVAALTSRAIAHSGRASYAGPFRFEPVSVVAMRYPRNPDQDSLVVGIEALWEPRLRIISLANRMADVTAIDEHGNPLPVASSAAKAEIPDVPVGEAPAVKLDLQLRLPPRTVQQIASLKGRLLATIPGKIETFRFDKLAAAKNVEQRMAGVTVTMEQVQKAAAGGRARDEKVAAGPRAPVEAWEVRMRVRFDDAGDALASHRQWIFANEACLEASDAKPLAYESFETTLQGKNEVGVAYTFRTDRPLSELTFVYKTPGTIVTAGYDYQLHDIKLP